ncbi:MAG: hypothetical protein LBR77_03240 [Lachnospiraceae bacterium]|jgi:hypothetical protein|nr:hypothetical protein [Lachnospiraceae bacterium]
MNHSVYGKEGVMMFGQNNSNNKDNLVWFLAIVGAVASVAAIAYAVFRFMEQEYVYDDDDFEDDFFDDDDDDFEWEEEGDGAKAAGSVPKQDASAGATSAQPETKGGGVSVEEEGISGAD